MTPTATPASPSSTSGSFSLTPAVHRALNANLPAIAITAVSTIIDEVPAYAGARAYMEKNIQQAVRIALGGFLTVAARNSTDPRPQAPARDASYELGRGEARNGRSMEALLSAYRIGARVSWREMSLVCLEAGVTAPEMAAFAERVFAYIDDLSAASIAGHADALASADRLRERDLERLAAELLRGESVETVTARAERARWEPPTELAVVLVPDAEYRPTRAVLDPRSLLLAEDLPGAPDEQAAAFIVPLTGGGPARQRLVRALDGHLAVVGPARPWTDAASSYQRALRAWRLRRTGIVTGRGRERSAGTSAYDTEANLPAMVLAADPSALADLRADVLAPLAGLSPASRGKLEQTLRLWLLNQGRREAIAEGLFVHPQTVRYRMGQLRELYGEKLDDPETLLALTIALG